MFPECGDNEVYSTCGSSCPKTCDTLEESQTCTKECVSGCFCKNDTVRDPITKKCVTEEMCPNRKYLLFNILKNT